MKLIVHTMILIPLVVAPSLTAHPGQPVQAAHATESSGPLAPFERLMGGKWIGGETSHTFEWGFGNRTVVGKTYFVSEEGHATLVAHGIWFWHPERQTIIGYSIAEQMPFELMEMTSRFEGTTLVNELRAITPDGAASEHIETWSFVGDDRYDWKLYREHIDEDDVWMTETFTRQ